MTQFVKNVVAEVSEAMSDAIAEAIKNQLGKLTVPDVMALLSGAGTDGGKGKGKSKGKEEVQTPKKRGRPAKAASEAQAPNVEGIKKKLNNAKNKTKGRRSSDEINKQIENVIKFLESNAEGVAVGDIAKKLKCESEDLTRAMHLALKDDLVSKKGEKRNTRYFPVSGALEKFEAKLAAAEEEASTSASEATEATEAAEAAEASSEEHLDTSVLDQSVDQSVPEADA